MNTLSVDRVGELVIQALERTAFVLAETVDPDELDGAFRPTRFARVSFSGAAEGHVVLAADEPFVLELASSILGVEAEDINPDVQGRDALNELANIVGGSVILEFGGAVKEYDYGLPETVTSEQLPPDPPDIVKCYITSECGALYVAWLPRAGAHTTA